MMSNTAGTFTPESSAGRSPSSSGMRLPYSDLGASAPKAGEVWRLNVGRQANMHGRPRMPELLLWNPNVQSRSFNVPDVMGRLKFK